MNLYQYIYIYIYLNTQIIRTIHIYQTELSNLTEARWALYIYALMKTMALRQLLITTLVATHYHFMATHYHHNMFEETHTTLTFYIYTASTTTQLVQYQSIKEMKPNDYSEFHVSDQHKLYIYPFIKKNIT